MSKFVVLWLLTLAVGIALTSGKKSLQESGIFNDSFSLL